MRILSMLCVAALAFPASSWGEQTGPGTGTGGMQPEILISVMPAVALEKAIAAPAGAIEHKSEVARDGPVTAVVRTRGCQKDETGGCRVSADVVVYKPDGSIHHEVKALELAGGSGSIALKFDREAPAGIYRVVARIRDLVGRRFATAERKFGLI
jgi:hypothetical protein